METTRSELTQLMLERSTYKALAIRATESLWDVFCMIMESIEEGTEPDMKVLEKAENVYYDLKEAMGQ